MASLPCPPELWARFSTLLDVAMDVPEAERGSWLAGLAGNDAAVKPWLARVLNHDASMETGFLSAPSGLGPDAVFAAGDLIGPYRLESRLGEGGMGEVWRAARIDDGPRREVALKLPHAELLGGPFRQRFARERDVLAALSHLHIAQIYDAGLSAGGHPFLALELVQGQPITDACRTECATLRRRIELVCQILDALVFAHQRLIVHRDIKPSNVLITPENGVKLLDFGIAKLLRPDGAAEFPVTGPAGRLATPGYAAPEQCAGGPVTVATDIFAAGILLFEVCTGHLPYGRMPAAMDAPAPLASSQADAAACGAPEGVRLARSLRGDLDAVIGQAIALNPADRYGSAEAFARDLRCCLAGHPVSARRIGFATRARKFVRRNRVGASLAALLVLALALGTAGIAWQAARATREAASAGREAERANAIKDFLLGLFAHADPRHGTPITTMTAKQVLDAGADRADAAFAKQPDTEVDLLASLGDIYETLDPPRGVAVRRRRLELARALYGADDPRVIEDSIELSAMLSLMNDFTGAAAVLETIKAPVLSRFGPASHQRAEWLMAHAYTVRAQRHGARMAEADDKAAIDILERHFPGSTEYPHALEDLAGNQEQMEEFTAAATNYEQMRQAEIATHTYDAIEKLQAGNDMASALEGEGQWQAADAAYRATRDQAEHLLGKDSTWYRFAVVHEAELLHMRGERRQADTLFDESATIFAQPGAAGGPTLRTLNRLYGYALLREGRAADAIPRLQDALKADRVKAPYVSRLYQDEQSLGEAYAAVGRAAEARTLLDAARAGWIDENGPASQHALAARERWARFLLNQGDESGATAELHAILDVAGGAPSAAAALAAADLASLAARHGDTAQAETLSARASAWLDAASAEYDARDRIDVWLARADVLWAEGKLGASRALAQQAVTAVEQYDAPVSPQLARARGVLAQ